MITSTTTTTYYPDAETRGRLRVWKTKLARRYDRFERRVKDQKTTTTLARHFIYKNGLGRQRAFTKLVRYFGDSGAILQGVRLLGGQPLAAWAVLKPRPTLEGYSDYDNAQHCVAVNYLLVGDMRRGCVTEGLWTLEVTDHALGRLLQRSRDITPEDIIMAAHHNLLQLRTDLVMQSVATGQFPVKAGTGGFICDKQEVDVSEEAGVADELLTRSFVARTWISDDMFGERQIALVPDGKLGERLGDDWLLPFSLRHMVAQGLTLVPMPATLAAPQLAARRRVHGR